MNSRINKIRDILDDKKASDIEIFDLTSKDYLVDYVVIATTLNPKHGFALLDHLKTELKFFFFPCSLIAACAKLPSPYFLFE